MSNPMDDERKAGAAKTAIPPVPVRKSSRERHCPSRFVARPSKQGLNVEDGDAIFSLQPQMQLSEGQVFDATMALRFSGRLREQNAAVNEPERKETFQSDGGRIMPMRGARNRSTLSHEDFEMPSYATINFGAKSKQEPKRANAKKRPIAATGAETEIKSSSAPRQPRVIVIGAGISGLACARELSERRHDVLVLEARRRLGGRLRTVDLMMQNVSDHSSKSDSTTASEGSELLKVREWSPVDVGGAFIHGTGQYTTRTDDDFSNVGSHDFGTSKSKSKSKSEEPKADNIRKSSRLSIDYDALSQKQSKGAAPISNRNLNPVFVLASRKLRLPVQAAEGAFTCLVDHEGDLISEQVDEEVSREFNEVLDLATKCCETGLMPVISERKGSAPARHSKEPPPGMTNDVPTNENSPNYVSDDTAHESLHNATQWRKIDPSTDFGTIFNECRTYNSAINKSTKVYSSKEMQVRNHLFQWHIANLEMSSGAPMSQLGQRWNDDEPFGYGGDHSYLEGGFRDVIEALSEGFDCRGVGDQSLQSKNNFARRSGDLAGNFSNTSSGAALLAPKTRGVIQCGIEVSGIEIVEKEDAKTLRKRRRVAAVDPSKCRRSSRANRGGKMTEILESLSSRRDSEAASESQTEPRIESDEEPTSVYGNKGSTVVRVNTACGLTLETDAVIVTLPLAILKIPPGAPGHISFNPPLSKMKQNALNRLGVGTYNKVCMSFSRPFWKHLPRHLSSSAPSYWNDPATHRFDFIGHASDEHGKDILFFNIRNAPILVAIYGGSEYSRDMENLHDKEVVAGCMGVLRKIFSKAASDCRLTRSQINDLTVPEWPVDYFVSRWGSDPFSRGSFSYIPQGVDGIAELKAMSQPVYDFSPEGTSDSDDKPQRPLVLFAGEGTSAYHPSTIHGAFESGIREASRLDLALQPGLAQFKFDDSFLYQPTFSVRPGTSGKQDYNIPKTDDASYPSFTAVEDASILRGVETFSSSSNAFAKVKEKMLDEDVTSAVDVKTRYDSLIGMLSKQQCGQDIANAAESGFDESNWDLPEGKTGSSWLAPDIPQGADKVKVSKKASRKNTTENLGPASALVVTGQSRSGRTIRRKIHYS